MAVYVLSIALSVVTLVSVLLLYVDSRGQRKAMGAWQEAAFATLEDLSARLLKIESARAESVALPTSPVSGRRDSPPPSTPRAHLEALGSAVARVDARVTALEAAMKPRSPANDAAPVKLVPDAPVTLPATREGDDGRRMSSLSPPPVEVLGHDEGPKR
jgi:hypothetical protein